MNEETILSVTEQQCEMMGFLDSVVEEQRELIVAEINKLYFVSQSEKIALTPAMIYTWIKIINDNISCGDVNWFMNDFWEYYKKTPTLHIEDHYDYGVIHKRIHGYLKWLENKKSLIL